MNYSKLLIEKQEYCYTLSDGNIKIPNITNLFKDKYSNDEIKVNKDKCINILKSREHLLRSTFKYLLQEEYINDLFSLDLNKVNFHNMVTQYNSILYQVYANIEVDEVGQVFVSRYEVDYYIDFQSKLEIDHVDMVIHLFCSLLDDYKCCSILMCTLNSFFNDLLYNNIPISEKIFFSFLYCQYKYIFFIITFNSFLWNDINNNYIKSHLLIDRNIYKTSTLLDLSFSESNKGMFKEGASLEDPFLYFIDKYRKDLTLFTIDPNNNKMHLFRYLEKKDNLLPISMTINNDNVLPITENMISFDYLQDLITSYIRTSLNSNWKFRHLLDKWRTELTKV